MKVAESKAAAQPAITTSFFSKETGQGFFRNNTSQGTFFSNNRTHGAIQRKLTIGQPNDKYEQEADAMADKVVQRLSNSGNIQTKPIAFARPITPVVQLKCADCAQEEQLQKKENLPIGKKLDRKPVFESNEELPDDEKSVQRKCDACEQEEKLQTKADSSVSQPGTPPKIESSLASTKGAGSPLPDVTRQQMGSSFGADFSDVRIHSDSAAIQMSKDLNAQAFTNGSDIYFNTGKYNANSKTGQHLLAHELTHVLQQNTAPAIQRQTPAQGQAIKEHGDITQVPAGLACSPATTSPADEQRTGFSLNSSSLSEDTLRQVRQFVQEWHDRGADAAVRLDGYASVEGAEGSNWTLSCQRAINIRNEMEHPTNGRPGIPSSFITIFAHGETNRFSQAELPPNRTVTITSVIPVRPPVIVTRLFRVTAASFLSCAVCNPFTDDGTLGITPPATEPLPGSSFRQMHHIEATLSTLDGSTIVPGTGLLLNTTNHMGDSHFCGTTGAGHIVGFAPASAPVIITSPIHGEGIQFESELSSRVGVTVPATLPGSPCGFLGTNSMIPVIGNRFRMRLFADGTKESEFLSATLYPSHFLYEDRSLKSFGGSPVRPRTDFFAWATSTGAPLRIAEIGFKALRFACCSPRVAAGLCPSTCVSGRSVPTSIPFGLATCATHAANLDRNPCPGACAPAGGSCTPLVLPANP